MLCTLAVGLIASVAYAHSPGNRQKLSTPQCFGSPPTITGPNYSSVAPPGDRQAIIGTPHADVIVGTRAPEWIVGNGGADVICAASGRDVVFVGWNGEADGRGHVSAGPGADYVEGSYAPDVLDLGDGGDKVDGEFGADVITAGPGEDFVRAQKGADRVFGGIGADLVVTSTGDDYADGGGGDDQISTGDGRDVGRGGGGDDEVHLLTQSDRGYGGAGDDFIGGWDGRDVLKGGPDADLCSGGLGYDRYTDCESRKEDTGRAPPPPPKVTLPPYQGTQPRKDLLNFLGYLRRLNRVRTRHQIGWIFARQHQLSVAAEDAVLLRWRRALDAGVPARTATLRRSVDHYEVRQIEADISHEIDRLRIAFHP